VRGRLLVRRVWRERALRIELNKITLERSFPFSGDPTRTCRFNKFTNACMNVIHSAMRCLFCKNDSSTSRSIEHIVPESLGNVDHILPAGIVCDRCNNYVAREIEKPLLDARYFRERRFQAGLPNKEKRIPALEAIHVQSRTPVDLMRVLGEDGISIGARPHVDESHWVKSIRKDRRGTLLIPIGEIPSECLISRFLAKVGLEVLAHRALNVPGGLDEIVDHPHLDELREYIRIGNPRKNWPYLRRSLYPAGFLFVDGAESYEVLHEFDILVTSKNEYYIILALFGEEYALNLGGPELEGYRQWLRQNNNVSPLYHGKNAL
jgi:hypothetical protein